MEPAKDEIIKALIVEAAQKLFQHYGLGKTTMEDIARSVGKSKGSLYYYYATKEEIFEAVVQKEKYIIFNDIKAAIAEAGTAEEKFKTFALTKYRSIKKRQILYRIIHEESLENACLFMLIRKKYDKVELDTIKDILSYGNETGEFDTIGDQKLEMVASVCAITLKGIQMNIDCDVLATDTVNEEMLSLSVDMLLKALRKGC